MILVLFCFGAGGQTHFAHAKSAIYNLGEGLSFPFIDMNTFILSRSLYMCCL